MRSEARGNIPPLLWRFQSMVNPDPKFDFGLTWNTVKFLSPMDGFIWSLGDFVHEIIGGRATLVTFFLIYFLSILIGAILLTRILEDS